MDTQVHVVRNNYGFGLCLVLMILGKIIFLFGNVNIEIKLCGNVYILFHDVGFYFKS